jgi:hypothetical protein
MPAVTQRSDGDTALMKLCRVQLFNADLPADVLLIWQVKESSWDAHCSIDVRPARLTGSGGRVSAWAG